MDFSQEVAIAGDSEALVNRIADKLLGGTISPTLKTIAPVLPVWRRRPLTSSHRSRLPGSATASAVTSQGPAGLNVSNDLPLNH